MGTTVGVGFSDHRNPVEAGKEAAGKAMAQAGGEKPAFVFVFASVGYNQQLLIRAIRAATADAPLSGCSGEGVITPDAVVESNFGVSVMAISSDELRFNNARVTEIGQRADRAGAELANALGPFVATDTIACFLFADGLVFDFDPFLAAFEQTMHPNKLPLFGGLAADNWASKRTYQYHDDEVFSEGISAVVMSGHGAMAWGINHGCVPVGNKSTITRSRGNIIEEIDGVPALTALKDYFDEEWQSQWGKTSLNLCLGFKTPEHISQNYEGFIIRYMVGKDDLAGSVTIHSDVRDGTDLWIVRRDQELIKNGIQAISQQIRSELGGRKPKFVLHFECVGRGKVVFREREKIELVRSLQRSIGEDVPWLGFYSFGEIGPINNHNCFHNFTSVVTAVY